MSMPSEKYGHVQRVTYTKVDDNDPNHLAIAGPKGNGIPALVIEFEYDGELYTHGITNASFSVKNPALKFLAFLGVKPSDFGDSQSLEVDDVRVPLARSGKKDYLINKEALEIGEERLKDTVWNPAIDYDEADIEINHDSDSRGMNVTVK